MLEQLVRQILVPLTWLLEPFFRYGSFYYDGWTLIHFWSGLMLLVILSVCKVKRRWLTLFGLLALWEVLEQGIISNLFTLFPQLHHVDPKKEYEAWFSMIFAEQYIDTFNDVFVGMLGGWMIERLFRWKRFRQNVHGFVIAVTAVTVSFAAVGQYGWLPVFLCFCMGVMLIVVFRGLAEKETSFKACAIIYIFYLPLWIVGSSLSASWRYSLFPAAAPLFFAGLYVLMSDLYERFAENFPFGLSLAGREST